MIRSLLLSFKMFMNSSLGKNLLTGIQLLAQMLFGNVYLLLIICI